MLLLNQHLVLFKNLLHFNCPEGIMSNKIFKVVVDYTLTLWAMTKACGFTGDHKSWCESPFSLRGEGIEEVNLYLISINKTSTIEDVKRKLSRLCMRPAKVEELLAFSTLYPEEQRQSYIVGLGSTCAIGRSREQVPYLFKNGVSTRAENCQWTEKYRFLVARKPLSEKRIKVRNIEATVNYNVNLNKMIESGKFDIVDPDICPDNFPIKGKGVIKNKFVMVNFNSTITSEHILEYFEEQGLRAATIEELLAVEARRNNDGENDFSLHALGSDWLDDDFQSLKDSQHRCTPSFGCWSDGRRRLRLSCAYSRSWHYEGNWFLAVRK